MKVQKCLITSQNQAYYHCHCEVDIKKPSLNLSGLDILTLRIKIWISWVQSIG